MPKQPQYEVNNILEYAIDIFLEHGFAAASMDEIINRTDFNRRAFYLEFTNKQQFFYAVLQYYIETKLLPCQIILKDSILSPVQSIEQYFINYQRILKKRGCLLVNSIAELGFNDKKIQAISRHFYDGLSLSFIACLEKGQQHNEIGAHTNIEHLSLQITCAVQGFAISSIIKEGKDDMQGALSSLLNDLKTVDK